MADKKITQLNPLVPADAAIADVVAVADISANETRKITVSDLTIAGVRLMPDGSIPGSKVDGGSLDVDALTPYSITGGVDGHIAVDTITDLNIAPNAIGASELADGSVDNNALLAGAVTGGPGGKIASKTITSGELADGSVGADALADDSVDTDAVQAGAITGAKLDSASFDRGIDLTLNKVGITNSIAAATAHGISWNEQGLITGYDASIPGTDIAIATDTTLGVVSVPTAGGLSVTGTGELSIGNTVAAGSGYKVTYNSQGLVTGSAAIDPADLPKATDTVFGVVRTPDDGVPGVTPIAAVDGELYHRSSATPGTYTKVVIDSYGLVTSGGPLEAGDIPDLSFDQITSGEISGAVLADKSVQSRHMADYSTVLAQEGQPTGQFLGQLWYQPSTAQLRVFGRGSSGDLWLAVGFGNLQANNLRWGGTYDADAGSILSLTSIGVAEGLTAGQAFPAPSDSLSGMYFVCQQAGNSINQPDLIGVEQTAGDWALCLDASQGWLHIDISSTPGGGGGATKLNDLIDVEIGGASSPFSTRVGIDADQILRYDGASGLWRNTDIIDGGNID